MTKPTGPRAARHRKRESPTGARRLRGSEHQQKCLELRKQGHSFAAIGKLMGLSKSTVVEHITRGLKECKAASLDEAEAVRRLELERMDRLLERLEARIKRHDVRAIEAALKVSVARARLLGIEAPTNVNVQGAGGLTIFLPAEDRDPEPTQDPHPELGAGVTIVNAPTLPVGTEEGAAGGG